MTSYVCEHYHGWRTHIPCPAYIHPDPDSIVCDRQTQPIGCTDMLNFCAYQIILLLWLNISGGNTTPYPTHAQVPFFPDRWTQSIYTRSMVSQYNVVYHV